MCNGLKKEEISMIDHEEESLVALADSVVNMDEELTIELAKAYINNGGDPYVAVYEGLAQGMDRVGELYETEEYYIPELLMCADAMYAGLDVLRPHLRSCETKKKAKVVIGVVEGDTHDIGKNLVKIMLEAAGFEVIDMGRDIPPVEFIKKAKELDADIIALSTLMSTTMGAMSEVMDLLKQDKLQDKIKVMIGGGPISKGFADRIGAFYAEDASKASKLAQNLIQQEVVKC